jgi:hypothetical protein
MKKEEDKITEGTKGKRKVGGNNIITMKIF